MIAQIVADPRMQAREAIVAVPDADLGSVRMQNLVPRLVRNLAEIRAHAGSGQPGVDLPLPAC